MIEIKELTMQFDGKTVLEGISAEIPDGCVYGMVGSNGAGKSTLLRLMAGIYKPHGGKVEYDGREVYENPDAKQNIVFVSDDPYFVPQATIVRMAKLYRSMYNGFSYQRLGRYCSEFGLDPKANIRTFSKGMKRQAAIILALSTMPKYLFLDETFDGLDPVMRLKVKKIIYDEVYDRKMTAILTSHSLRELEDTCDKLALLHSGGIVFQSDVNDLKTTLFKVQVAFSRPYGREMFDGINILEYKQNATVATMIVRGDESAVKERIGGMSPLLLDILPLSLEEVFIYEMQVRGYTADESLFGR